LGGRGLGPEKSHKIHNMQYRMQNTAAEKLMSMKLPMYLFFNMSLRLNDFDRGKSIIRAIGRGGP
jgi:hypothetical protein